MIEQTYSAFHTFDFRFSGQMFWVQDFTTSKNQVLRITSVLGNNLNEYDDWHLYIQEGEGFSDLIELGEEMVFRSKTSTNHVPIARVDVDLFLEKPGFRRMFSEIFKEKNDMLEALFMTEFIISKTLDAHREYVETLEQRMDDQRGVLTAGTNGTDRDTSFLREGLWVFGKEGLVKWFLFEYKRKFPKKNEDA